MTYRVLRFTRYGHLQDIGWLDINAASMTFAVDDGGVRAALVKVRDDGYVDKWVSTGKPPGARCSLGIRQEAIGAPDFFSALEDRLKRSLGVILEPALAVEDAGGL